MSEQALKGPEDRKKHSVGEVLARDAKEQAMHEKKQRVRAGGVAFGKFDKNPQPDRDKGEVSYDEYIEARKAADKQAGEHEIVLDGSGTPHHIDTWKFASPKEYAAQFEDEEDSRFSKLKKRIPLNEEARYEDNDWRLEHQTPYETLGVAGLAKEMASAQERDDRTAQEDIMRALDAHLTEASMQDGTETAEQAQQRYEDETKEFDALVERHRNLHRVAKGGKPEAPGKIVIKDESETATQNAADFTFNVDNQDEAEFDTTTSAVEAEQEDSPEESEKAPAIKHALYEGEEVEVAPNAFTNANTEKVYSIRYKKGRKKGRQRLVYEKDLEFIDAETQVDEQNTAPEDEQPAGETEGGEAEDAYRDTLFDMPVEEPKEVQGELLSEAGDTVNYDMMASEEAAEAARREDEEAQKAKELEQASLFKKFKHWFNGEQSKRREYGGVAYWAEKGNRAGAYILNVGTKKEGLSEPEKEKIRKRNRVAFIAGASVIGAAMLYKFGYDHGFDNSADANDIASNLDNLDGGMPAENVEQNGSDATDSVLPPLMPDAGEVPDGAMTSPITGNVLPNIDVIDPITAEGGDSGVENTPAEGGALPGEELRWGPEGEIPTEGFAVEGGEGGVSLFTSEELGLTRDDWYDNQNELLRRFPNEFYRMSDGNVGILRPGPLSQEVQEFIKTLK